MSIKAFARLEVPKNAKGDPWVTRTLNIKQFLAFLCTGGIAAMVNFFSRIFYNHWVSFSNAIIMAYITGMIVAFILARLFVFKKSRRALHHSAFYFVIVNLVGITQTWLISMGLISYANFSREFAHAVGIMFPVFTSYMGHKYISFK